MQVATKSINANFLTFKTTNKMENNQLELEARNKAIRLKIAELTNNVKTAQSGLLTAKREHLETAFEKFKQAEDALTEYEESVKPAEQIALEKKIAELEEKLAPLQKERDEAAEELKKVLPSWSAPSTRKPKEGSTATVSMTAEIKAQVIELKKAGKRNNEIAEITGLNNGQISPVLQKAGLTEKR